MLVTSETAGIHHRNHSQQDIERHATQEPGIDIPNAVRAHRRQDDTEADAFVLVGVGLVHSVYFKPRMFTLPLYIARYLS